MNEKTEKFIEKARKVHGDKYGYSKVLYVNAKEKVVIICPIHGELDLQLRRDEYLRTYCSEHSVKLIEIKYDCDVNEILTRKILNKEL